MFVKTLVPTCQNTRYHDLQVSRVKLKSHVLLNAVIAALCTFSTVSNCCLFRIDFFHWRKEETARGKFWKSANCPAWQTWNWVISLTFQFMHVLYTL